MRRVLGNEIEWEVFLVKFFPSEIVGDRKGAKSTNLELESN